MFNDTGYIKKLEELRYFFVNILKKQIAINRAQSSSDIMTYSPAMKKQLLVKFAQIFNVNFTNDIEKLINQIESVIMYSNNLEQTKQQFQIIFGVLTAAYHDFKNQSLTNSIESTVSTEISSIEQNTFVNNEAYYHSYQESFTQLLLNNNTSDSINNNAIESEYEDNSCFNNFPTFFYQSRSPINNNIDTNHSPSFNQHPMFFGTASFPINHSVIQNGSGYSIESPLSTYGISRQDIALLDMKVKSEDNKVKEKKVELLDITRHLPRSLLISSTDYLDCLDNSQPEQNVEQSKLTY